MPDAWRSLKLLMVGHGAFWQDSATPRRTDGLWYAYRNHSLLPALSGSKQTRHCPYGVKATRGQSGPILSRRRTCKRAFVEHFLPGPEFFHTHAIAGTIRCGKGGDRKPLKRVRVDCESNACDRPLEDRKEKDRCWVSGRCRNFQF